MNKAALFCDGTEGYVYPPEPKENELVTFRFRTAKDDADRVGLVTSADTYVMEKECTQGEFDYYTFEVRLGAEPFRYCFEVQSGTEKYYYEVYRLKCTSKIKTTLPKKFYIIVSYSNDNLDELYISESEPKSIKKVKKSGKISLQ